MNMDVAIGPTSSDVGSRLFALQLLIALADTTAHHQHNAVVFPLGMFFGVRLRSMSCNHLYRKRYATVRAFAGRDLNRIAYEQSTSAVALSRLQNGHQL
jgi:hypothetical protein